MAKIRVLTEDLANKIAAGEVVERPASVVKELVENSLDAGATRIRVVIEAGGKGLVRVEDDGVGMDPDDLQLAVQRHATSKLASADDLDAIGTLGFRGEALPAIAAVAVVRIATCADEAAAPGCRLVVRGGAIEGCEEVAAARGTVVEVQSLFFNTPARRKFLRSDAREAALVAETVSMLALAHPDRGFTLLSDGRTLIALDPDPDRRARVRRVVPVEDPLLEARYANEWIAVEGWMAGGGQSRSDRSAQRIIVNGRPVRDRAVSHAISQACAPAMPPHRHAILTLFLDLPAGAVDVNVHPTKAEVRFRAPVQVHHAVTSALRSALRDSPARGPVPAARELSAGTGGAAGAWRGGLSEPLPMPAFSAAPRRGLAVGEASAGGGRAGPAAVAGWSGRVEGAAGRRGRSVIAQYRNSYVLAADATGLLLVDQHAAHERVLFEQLIGAAERGESSDEAAASAGSRAQALLVPVSVALAPVERAMLSSCGERLAELGFEVEPFGADGALLRSLPAAFAVSDAAGLLRDILSDLSRERAVMDEEPGSVERFPGQGVILKARRRLAASAACQAAVKVNYPLTLEKMEWLLAALEACRVPGACPHGRPTLVRFEHAAIEKAFLRV